MLKVLPKNFLPDETHLRGKKYYEPGKNKSLKQNIKFVNPTK